MSPLAPARYPARVLAHVALPILVPLHIVAIGTLVPMAAYGLRRWLEDRHERHQPTE